MKRGFLNTKHAQQSIGKAYVTEPELSRQPRLPRSDTQQSGRPVADGDATDVKMTAVGQVPYCNYLKLSRRVPCRSNLYAATSSRDGSDRKMEVDHDPPTSYSNKGKGKQSDDSATDYAGNDSIGLPDIRPLPQAPVHRSAQEEFLHTVPKSYGIKKRAIFCLWPRDQNGRAIMPGKKIRGTLSPEGYPWGATLYDFYGVHRIPGVPGMMTYMTGSALYEAMEEMGEMNTALDGIEWAMSEGTPMELDIADTLESIEKVESLVLPTPVIPFEDCPPIQLQERLPLHLLPKKLCVHDPFDLLSANVQEFCDMSWNSRSDIVRTYTLGLSEPACKEAEETRRKEEEEDQFKARTLVLLRFKRSRQEVENFEPEIEISLPPYPRRLTKVEESHLYLSPVAGVATGHHSVVYNGELELPRELFASPHMCPMCFEENANKEIQRLKDTGRWEKLLTWNAVWWGPKGFTSIETTEEDLDEVNDMPRFENEGEIVERKLVCIVPHDMPKDPPLIFDVLDKMDVWTKLKAKKFGEQVIVDLRRPEKRNEDDATYSPCPLIRINPSTSYDRQLKCVHDPAGVPRTARFTVVAKLSTENDHHLANEAINYQNFPDHFFNHYDGYALISQLHGIVPMGAIVPQFYGYYKPKPKGRGKYLSPILLLEHCGEPIDPEKLSHEDREECASLLLRFQRARWLHESFETSKFLVQYGNPYQRMFYKKSPASFRLIDFGRSRKFDTVQEKRIEEMEALKMLQGPGIGKMNATLLMG